MMYRAILPLCAALMLGALPVSAQDAPKAEATKADTLKSPECQQLAEPATKDVVEADATAPSNSGSTGWSGGTGGSHIGTNPSGGSQHTNTWQPPTARGLDLRGQPEPAPATC